MIYINLNGKIVASDKASIPVDNGAFRYGYGLFETLLVRHCAIDLWAYHWERLSGGLQQLYLTMPALWSSSSIENEVLKTVSRNGAGELCRVRLQLFAGGGGLFSSGAQVPQYLIECFPLDPVITALNENGLVTGIATGMRKSIDPVSHLKTCSALIYALAAREAQQHKWNDALVQNQHGNIIESAIANIFWIKNNSVFTPPLSEGCIAGIMRRFVAGRIQVHEKILTFEELCSADEVFLTNSVRRIKWVASCGEATYGRRKTEQLFRELFA